VREPDFAFLGEKVAVRPQELQMAQSLIENLSGDFDASEYNDEYREAILRLIDAKLEGGEGLPAAPAGDAADSSGVVDLMAALQASVARTAKPGSATETGVKHEPSAPPAQRATAAKRASGKPAKAPARGAAAKKAPAKKTAVKKTAVKRAATPGAAKTA
jgi:DNA end-binding protein Ku